VLVGAVWAGVERLRLQPFADDGAPAGPVEDVSLAEVAGRAEPAGRPDARWLWASTAAMYPRLLAAGVRIGRCHDLELTEGLLLAHDGRYGEPRSLAAITARLAGRDAPPDPLPPDPTGPARQETLFEAAPPEPVDLAAIGAAYRSQLERMAKTEHPGRFKLLVAAESAGALIAAEMGFCGLPWRADVHDELLRELLGEPSRLGGGPPKRLAELTERIAEAFGQRIHPDSPAEVLRAFSRQGITLPSTRAWVLRQVEHPAVPLLLEFKELYRIWTAHGWSWRDQWVHSGRFRAEYVPAGVVSGRWATRGGGALQIPKAVRRAAVADDGWTFVVADASQLEPRVLAAVADDGGLARAAAAGDLYEALARDAFGGDRAKAKVALLGAMYGQTGGAALPALAVLRERFPKAWEVVERAAREGEHGDLVRSWLGRTCPPPGPNDHIPERARARGRFTRNFVIQATAAEWALTWLATVRTRLAGTEMELVFFQHDEVVVHCPRENAEAVVAAVTTAAEQAGRLLFKNSPVRFPLDVSVVRSYADAA
jgi:DNA polymerase-1